MDWSEELAQEERVRKANRELAEAINAEALRNPASPYARKFVGISDGEVVVVADTMIEMGRRLHRIQPILRRRCWVEAGVDYDGVRKANQELAAAIKAVTRADPDSPYAGKFVGIADGKVVIVADNAAEVCARLREVQPNDRLVWCVEASKEGRAEYV